MSRFGHRKPWKSGESASRTSRQRDLVRELVKPRFRIFFEKCWCRNAFINFLRTKPTWIWLEFYFRILTNVFLRAIRLILSKYSFCVAKTYRFGHRKPWTSGKSVSRTSLQRDLPRISYILYPMVFWKCRNAFINFLRTKTIRIWLVFYFRILCKLFLSAIRLI